MAANVPTEWEFLGNPGFLPGGIEELFDNFDELSEDLNSLLRTIKTGLTFVNTILIDGLNPLLLIVQFILEEILDFIDTLREAGIYFLKIVPGSDTNTRFIKLKDVLPGLVTSTTAGFHILTRDDILQKYVESFDDPGDLKKPTTADDAVAGGFVLFFGVGSDDVKLFISGLTKMLELVQIVTDLYQQLFGSDVYRKLFRETTSLLGIIQDSESFVFSPLPRPTNNIGDSTLEVDANIQPGTPGESKGGKIKIVVGSLQNLNIAEFTLRFDSWTNTKSKHVFNLSFLKFTAQTNTNEHRIESSASLKNAKVGDLVLNVTRNNAISYILGISSDKRLVISPSIEDQTAGDDIRINAVPINFINEISGGDKIFVDNPEGPTLKFIGPPPKSTSPDWETKRIARDMIPPLGNLLDDIYGVVEGFKDQSTGASQAMSNLIAFIESKIIVIEQVQASITSTRAYFQKIRDTFKALEEVKLANIRSLFVNVQPGGINILKQAVLDETLDNRPENSQYCMLLSIVGSGPGLGLISFLLGLRPTFDINEGTPFQIEFDEDAVKKEYGLT